MERIKRGDAWREQKEGGGGRETRRKKIGMLRNNKRT